MVVCPSRYTFVTSLTRRGNYKPFPSPYHTQTCYTYLDSGVEGEDGHDPPHPGGAVGERPILSLDGRHVAIVTKDPSLSHGLNGLEPAGREGVHRVVQLPRFSELRRGNYVVLENC